MKNYRPFLIIAAVLAVAVIAFAALWRGGRNTESSKGVASLQTTNDQKRKPPADAVVTLEEFGDYQCPPCGALHPGLKKLKQEFGPNLNFVFRNLPLTSIHKNAMTAAQAAEAARVQDHFWEMHDLLYENQDLWKDDINPRSIFLKFAADLGLDTARFARDMDDKQVKLRIETDETAAAELGVNGTPTVLLDGRQMLYEATNAEGIRKGIEFIMGRKASPPP